MPNELWSDVGAGVGGWVEGELASVPNLSFFLIKETWTCATKRHHAELSSNILLTRNLPFESDIRQ